MKKQFYKLIIVSLLAVNASFVWSERAIAVEGSSPSKPLIGLNMEVDGDQPVNYEISAPYTKAILSAGGIPILIPPMAKEELKQLLSKLDGILMIGGRDYPTSLYGKKNHGTIVEMHDERTTFDQLLVSEVAKNKKLPFLGICAGAQILNIKNGGSLVRDIPSKYSKSKLKHASPNGWQEGFNMHKVSLDKNSFIACIYGKTNLTVPSSHHQCVDKIGKGLKVSARAPDGVAESIESVSQDRFMVGVQWHPERDYKNNKLLFQKFIDSCKHYRLALKIN